MIDVCPVCGGDEITLESSRATETSTIHCNDCGLYIQSRIDEDELQKLWNDMDRRKFTA